MTRTTLASFVLAVAAFLPATATAGLVTNTGFEGGGAFFTNSIPNWTIGNPGVAGGWCPGASPDVHSGLCAAYFQQGGVGSISQILTTTPGADYVLTFYYFASSGGGTQVPNDLEVLFDGAQVFHVSDSTLTAHTLQTVNVTATGSSTVLQFNGFSTPSFLFVDDVDVVLASESGVPEPATYLSSIAGLALIGLLHRRRASFSAQ